MASIHHIDTGTSADDINNLIRNAESGATIQFAAGNHLLDDGLRIDRSDISLVGAGSQETTLTFTDEALARNSETGIHVEGEMESHVGLLESGVEEGDRQLTLDRGHDLKPGDTVRVWQENDDAFFDAIGDTAWRKVEHAELRTSMARVESVNGDTLTLDRGVHFDLEAGKTQVDRWNTADDVTLDGFGIEFQLGEPDPGEFSNTLGDLGRYKAVLMEGTQGANLTDIEVNDGPSTAFRFSKALDLVADDIQAHGTFNKGGGGNGYAYELHESYDGSLTGLEDSGMRHGLVFASWRSSVGNDAEVVFTDRDINLHGGRDHDNSVRVRESVRDADNDKMSTSLWINQGGESFGAPTDPDANTVTFDYLIGSRRDDVIQGSDDGVYLNGGLGYDTLVGGAGDDILEGGPNNGWGDNYLDGGAGLDTARFTGDYADNEIEFAGDEVIVTRAGSVDTLVNMEYAVFGDGTKLDLSAKTTSQGEPLAFPTAESMGANDDEESAPTDTDTETEPTDTEEEAAQPDPIDTSGDVELTSNTTSSWSTGFVAEVFVKNLSDQAIQNPEVTFDLGADIDEVWNGQVDNVDGSYQVRHDTTLEPGETWRFSFKAYGDDQSLPDNMTVSSDEGLIDSGTQTETSDSTDTETETEASEPTDTETETEVSEPTNTETETEEPEPTDTTTEIGLTGNITSSWSTGYVAEIFVKNLSDQIIQDPEVGFELGADIDTVWNGEVEDAEGGYSIRDDNALAPGETWRFSFKAYGDDQTLPDYMTVKTNGSSVDTETGTQMTSNITSSWNSGYVAEVFVENTSDQAIQDPEILFDLDADIDTVWNGLFEDVEGGYRISDDNPSTLDPGETWRFSFKAYGEDELPEQRVSETSDSELQVQLLGLGNDSGELVMG